MDRYARMLSTLKTRTAMERFSRLYGRREGELARQLTRYTELVKRHEDIFHSSAPLYMISAAGRTELLGNHTDHNNGKVMAAAVNMDTLAAVTPREDNRIQIQSAGFPALDISLDALAMKEEEKGSSAALVRGVAARMAELGYKVGGFDAAITSDVLSGSGLSSSACYEVLIVLILDTLYNGSTIDAVTRAKISQYAENEYFGKPSGLMDQLASSVGGLVYIDFKNLPDEPEIHPLTFDFSRKSYSLIVVNTRGSHDDLTVEYASVRSDMNHVAAVFNEKVLRRVRPDEFWQNIGQVRHACGDRACLRAAHYFNENDRVKQLEKAVKNDDFERIKALVLASGRSSWQMLQNVYVPGASQPVALGLALAEEILQSKGAWRVHGGGFAGTILNIVPDEMVDSFVRRMDNVFGTGSCHVLSVRPEGAMCVFEEL